MTIRSIISSITRREWFMVGLSALLVSVVTAIPVWVGLHQATLRDAVWTGRQVFGPGDFSVYLSLIQQAKDGHLLFDNLFTPEHSIPTLNIFWLGVGLLAKCVSISPLAAYHLARTLLIPILAVIAYAAIAYFLRPVKERVTAFIVFMFGSGVGLYFMMLFPEPNPVSSSYEWPIDLWVAEGQAFSSMLYSPHFTASWALLILTVTLAVVAVERASLRYSVLAGLAGMALLQFHPYHVPTLLTVMAIAVGLRVWQQRRIEPRLLLNGAVYAALLVPPLAYHYAFARLDWYGRYFSYSNITLSPSTVHVFIGFGLTGLVAVVSMFMRTSKDAGDDARFRRQFLIVWIVAQFLLLYAPINFQRRLAEGLSFPLAILAAPVFVSLADKLRRRFGLWTLAVLLMIGIVLIFPSSFAAVGRNIVLYTENRPPLAFISRGEAEAFAWLSKETAYELTSIMSAAQSGNLIVGYADRRVFMGQWSQTIDVAAKYRAARRFYGSEMTDDESVALLSHFGITHVFVGEEERRLGGAALAGKSFLKQALANDTVVIYETNLAGAAISAE